MALWLMSVGDAVNKEPLHLVIAPKLKLIVFSNIAHFNKIISGHPTKN